MDPLENSNDLIIVLGMLIVWLVANVRFNDSRILVSGTPGQSMGWKKYLNGIFSLSPGKQNLLIRPPRANTTAFRYWLYQFLYALIAILVYLLVFFEPNISAELQEIIGWFATRGIPVIGDARPLVTAAFVVLVLPNVPPFRWADTSLRRILYERALIPAQQLREANRLNLAAYNPPLGIYERMHKIALAESFNERDINYTPRNPTTQSLWFKGLLLIEHVKIWEADDSYKTAFAALKEPDSNRRSVDVVKEMQRELVADARVYFDEVRRDKGQDSEALSRREDEFRANCRNLLKKIFTLLAAVSLHSHYSDYERIKQFGKLGLRLEPEPGGPLPNANDMFILIFILNVILVAPLAMNLGLAKAIMIGCILLSAVLSPVVLARFCPRIKQSNVKSYAPNVVYPVLSGITAASAGFLILVVSGALVAPSEYCTYSGLLRYTNCSYPWSILHAGTALLLAVCLCMGKYPDVRKLQGWRRYQQWGSFTDATICAFFMFLIAAFVAMPLLKSLLPDLASNDMQVMVVRRITLVAFILGFVVPTWYRAHKVRSAASDRRTDPDERKRFQEDLNAIRQGHIHTGSNA